MKLCERDLEIDFIDAVNAFVFDQTNPKKDHFHAISKMHRVDFIVELEDSELFIELKDPSHPKTTSLALHDFTSNLDHLIDSLVHKFIHTFLYRWAEEQINKPIHYLVLITLDPSLTHHINQKLLQALPPMQVVDSRWKKPLFKSCSVLNIEQWNKAFPKWPIKRLST